MTASPYPSGTSALRGRYLVKHRGWNAVLRLRDGVLRTVVDAGAARGDDIPAPRRLLLGVGGHLGDAVIATTIVGPLRRAFPGVEIGVLAGSWCAPVFAGHAAVRWFHPVDHWKTNRDARSFVARWRRYARTRTAAAAQIAEVGYDVAIDLYPFYPNAIDLLWRARIPTRIGYVSGGDGPLLTHAAEWRDSRLHTAEQHAALVRRWLPRVNADADLAYDLPPVSGDAAASGDALLAEIGIKQGERFVLLHPGAGDTRKLWPIERWQALARELCRPGADMSRVVITGHGARDESLARDIQSAAPAALSLAGRTSWATFRRVIARARVVVGADSVALHVAAAADVPTVAIAAAMSDPAHWRPLGARAIVLSQPVACAPCFRSSGCAAMACVREVSVEHVIGALSAAFEQL